MKKILSLIFLICLVLQFQLNAHEASIRAIVNAKTLNVRTGLGKHFKINSNFKLNITDVVRILK